MTRSMLWHQGTCGRAVMRDGVRVAGRRGALLRMSLTDESQRQEPQPTTSEGVTIKDETHLTDGYKCHYRVATPSADQRREKTPPIVLVHGFGINCEHFSRNIAVIAAATGAPVYAVDLLGFGKSQKMNNVIFGESLWSWQVTELIEQVIKSEKVIMVGHSIGGYVCMNVAQQNQEKVAGLCLVNAAGRFGSLNPIGFPIPILKIPAIADKVGAFLFEKNRRPEQVRQTLEQVYVDKSQIDDALINAIVEPSQTPEAEDCGPAIFSSLFTSPKGKAWDELLIQEGDNRGYLGPLLCVWGERDPWILPLYINMIQEMRPDVEVQWVEAGHCPHHERPAEFNQYVSEWVNRITENPKEYPIAYIPRQQRLRLF